VTHGPRLRTRLALLYGVLFLAVSAILLAVADLPVLRFHETSRARTQGLSLNDHASVRAGSNLHQVLGYSAVVLVAAAVLAAAAGWLVADRALRPLRAITKSARATSASNLRQRLSVAASYEEFTELGETLEDLYRRLEASFESQRRFVANASHELRTPLAAERTLLQVTLADPDASPQTLRSACEELLALGAHQERLIDALLTLASCQQEIDRWELVDLAAVTRDVVAGRSEQAARRGVKVCAALGPAVAPGDPRLVAILVSNLVDNALRHNAPGGIAEVRTYVSSGPGGPGGLGGAGGPRGGSAAISVANTGPVIPPADVGRLFEPFQQLGADRVRRDGGHGLGLAIVEAIAAAHAAALTALARPGGGLEITVAFDRADARDTPGTGRGRSVARQPPQLG
jgi:signal transduction histidine kinase